MPETNLRSYHMPGEDGEIVLEPVRPTRPPFLKAVMLSESDVDILEEVGSCLCRMGALDSGNALVGMAAQWRIG